MSRAKVVDGRQIQEKIKGKLRQEITASERDLRLDILRTGGDKLTKVFTQLKHDFGESIGVDVNIHTLSAAVGTDTAVSKLEEITSDSKSNGVIVQLPLAEGVDADQVLKAISTDKDVDVLSPAARNKFATGSLSILPPVVGAVAEICDRFGVDLENKSTAVVGHGKLVGWPTAVWLENNFSQPIVLDKGDDLKRLSQADVVISGVGKPHIIQPEHVSKGVALIDAGTSQTQGGTKGDIDPACKSKASIFAPVPGGVGPITIAKLFANLVELSAG